MVIQFFSVCYLSVIICQILFLRYALNHKAKGNRFFIGVQLVSIFIVLLAGLNMLFLHFGETGFLLSKISFSGFAALFMIEVGIFTKIKITSFADKSKYTSLVIFIVSIVVAISCSMSFINVSTEIFFNYEIVPIRPFYKVLSNQTAEAEHMIVFTPGKLWNSYAFFWFILVFIYALLDFMRIVMRSVINSIHEVMIIFIFVFEFVFFIKFINNPSYLCFELSLFCILLPFMYYYFVFEDKPWIIKRSLRSKLYRYNSAFCVIFNADDLLVDYNESAKKFFGFSNKDILRISLGEFISDYVPLGNVPYDSFSVDQILIKGKKSEKLSCKLEYHRINYFKNATVCSFFIISDISDLIKKFSDIQQASMTDNITGLHAQHVLAKKIRELNMYRRFPYTVATCSATLKNVEDHARNNNMALISAAECIRSKIRSTDFAAYENGNIVLLFPEEFKDAKHVMNRIEACIKEECSKDFDIDFIYGIASRETPDTDIQDTINNANSNMFQKKVDSKD